MEAKGAPCRWRGEPFEIWGGVGPRNRLTGKELGRYAFSALNTMGSEADLQYLTGRILQLLHTRDPAMPDIEVFYGKLRRANWRSWRQAEVLETLFDALWSDVLTTDNPHEDAAGLVCALGSAEETITPRLAQWAELGRSAAVRQLHEFVTRDCRTRSGLLVPVNAYWDETLPTYGEIVDWLNAGPVLRGVVAAFDRTEDADLLELLTDLHGFLGPPRG